MKRYKNLEIKNLANKSELYIYGDIISGDWKWDDSDVTTNEIRDFLKEIEDAKELDIYINSGGGSVFAGQAIYNMLKRHKAKKTVYIDGLAASIASVIALVGDKVIIPSNAYFMIHKAWAWEIGNADDMLKMAATLEKIDEGILNVYKENLKDGVSEETIRQLIAEETWMTGDEAANYFKNIEVIEPVEAAACVSDELMQKYKNAPKLNAKPKDQPSQSEETEDNLDEELEMLAMELEISSSF